MSRINCDILNELDSSYIEYQLTENVSRYYKTINGFLTNSFVDVYYDEQDNIAKIDDHRYDADNILSIKNEYINRNIPSKYIYEEEYYLDKIDSRNIVYYYIDNEFIPIEIIFASYRSEDKVIQIPYSINLNDGTYLDYSLINSLS